MYYHSLNGVGDRADDGRDYSISHRKIADKGLAWVVQQIYSIFDFVCEDPQGARGLLRLSAEGLIRELEITVSFSDYRIQETGYANLRATLFEVGIAEVAI